MALVYKICSAWLWREAERTGRFEGAPVDLADGFIHLSTADQFAETAARHFSGQSDLLLLGLDAEALGPALRWEPSRGGDLFPHLYRPFATGEVQWAKPLPLGADGRHIVPADLAGRAPDTASAAFDPASSGWTRREGERFIGLVGPIWEKAEGDARRYGLLAEERHLNRGGVMHGGMVMTFADQALGLAAWAANGERPQATIQLDTHFVSGVREGDFVEARCRVVRQTRSLLFMSAELAVGERVAATSNGIWKLSRR